MKSLNRIILFMLVGILFVFSLPVSADPVGKELFVAANGNDSYTRDQNDIDHPWATPQKAWENAQTGDTVNFRAGTYYVTSTISTKYTGYNGTADHPITFRSYPGETATIDSGTLAQTVEIEKSWNIIKNLNFTGGSMVFQFGYNTNVNGGMVENCTAQGWAGGDNRGFVSVRGGAMNITIKDCRIIGPGTTGVHLNTACIVAMNAKGLKLLHNELSNAPMGLYFKHGEDLTYDTGIEIAYNYVHDTSRYSMFFNTGYAYVHDNLMGLNNNHFFFNSSNGGPNGDHNIITHNTCYNSSLVLYGDDNGALYNTVRDNITVKTMKIFSYSSTPGYDTNTFDYNLYPSGNAVFLYSTNYTLAAWQALLGQDAHSLSGTPTFTNGSGTMTEIADFSLASNSMGKNTASDGKDMGADISLVINPYQTSSSDKSALNAAITAAQNLNSANYTQESWNNVQTALGNALAVQANGAATQAEVDAVSTALTGAIANLMPVISGISLDRTNYALRTDGVRQTRQIVVTADLSGSGTLLLTQGITYTSGDQSIATVDSQGIITAVAEGRTDIYVEYHIKTYTYMT